MFATPALPTATSALPTSYAPLVHPAMLCSTAPATPPALHLTTYRIALSAHFATLSARPARARPTAPAAPPPPTSTSGVASASAPTGLTPPPPPTNA
jgi:hypothetical protein